jgi:CheY-like chemotaxis protein
MIAAKCTAMDTNCCDKMKSNRPPDDQTDITNRMRRLDAAHPSPVRQADTREAAVHKSILIADRDDNARTGLANLLEEMGYDVTLARSADDALALARQHWPDVAILDIGGAELEGLAAPHQLREMADARSLLLIALTGWGQPQYRDMALAAGYDVHLVKPVGADQLSLVLSMVCE